LGLRLKGKLMNRDDPNLRLATYGTLAPGRSNAHMLAKIEGQWSVGTVRGHLVEKGWGAALGFPGIILDAAGPEVQVHVFASQDMPNHWARLDAFEGDGYRRVPVAVNAGDDQVTASIYVLAEG
jgi:gamma-glutamylcyclotransferase (GGCT)/AIG2-like uncharacterized protein YtfP